MSSRRCCVSALVVVALFAAAPLVAQDGGSTAPRCKCPPRGGPIPPGPTPDSSRPDGDRRDHDRALRVPPLAPLGLLGFLLGAANALPTAAVPAAPLASGGTSPRIADTDRTIADSVPADVPISVAADSDAAPPDKDTEVQIAFRAKADSLAQGLRAPDTATWLPTLVAAGMALVGAGIALLRKSDA